MATTPAVTIFSPQQLQQIVSQTIPQNLPDGHKNAIVGTVDQDGAQVVAGFKLGQNDHWEVTGAFRHQWSGENEVGASIIASW